MRHTTALAIASAAIMAVSSRANAVTVTTAADLATALSTSPAGTRVLLGDNLDLTGWTTVDGFSGTLDGQGYKIENLDKPLFGTITGDLAISNLVVKDAYVDVPSTVAAAVLINSVTAANLAVENVTFTGTTLRNAKRTSTSGVGFAVGSCDVTGTASFKDCLVDSGCSLVMGAGIHGGIAGRAKATGAGAAISFEHCCMAASLSTAVGDGNWFGGIAGNIEVVGAGANANQFAHLSVYGCTNYTGNTSAWTGANRCYAGIVYSAVGGGNSAMGEGAFRRCANYGSYESNGTFSSSGTHFGGIIGYWGYGNLTMEDCVNYGDILCSNYNPPRPYVGGMVGVIDETWKGGCYAEIVGCANCGDLRGLYAGGMVGYVSHYNNAKMVGTTIIKSCLNTGTLTTLTDDIPPGQAISMLTSATAYPVVTIEGGLYATNALIGAYAENASVTSFSTAGNVFPDASEGLVDGTDVATLNAYDSCNLWKQGHTHPILKILPDEAAPDTIVATFQDWDGTVLKQKTIARGGYCYPPAQNPERANYTFMGWNPSVFSGLTSNTTFTAQYEGGIVEYTVSFVDWDDTSLKEESVVRGGAATPPDDPVREGHFFSGWDTAFDNVTGPLTVRAQYVPEHIQVATSAELAAAVAASATFPGATIHLSADIELPADWAAQNFSATLDGAGHAILCPNGGLPLFQNLAGCASNFVVDAASEGAPTTNTLPANVVFGAVAKTLSGGAIRDVTVENLVVTMDNNCSFGFIAGKMTDGAAIERCLVAATCLSRQKQTAGAGGIVGVIDRTDAFAPVDGDGNPVVGETLALVADCTNRAPVVIYATGPLVSGGVVGKANVHNTTYQPSMRILRCVNEADVTATVNLGNYSVSLGGILGERNFNANGFGGALSIIGCANFGDICSPGTTSANLGGIVGYLYRACEAVLEGCVNRGDIGTATVYDGVTAVTGNNAGGLIGYVSSLYGGNPVTATNCANYGAVAAGLCAGGFVGRFNANQGHPDTTLMFYNCANYGQPVAVGANAKAGQIFAEFETLVADSPYRQYGAVNSFFMTDQFYAVDSGSTIITNGLVTAADAGYNASAAKRALNAAVAESNGIYEEWRVGKAGPELLPFWDGFVPFTVIMLK